MNETLTPQPDVTGEPRPQSVAGEGPSETVAGTAADNLQDYQDRFLLDLLARAKDQGLTVGEIKKKVQAKRAQQHLELGLDHATRRLEELQQEGFIQIHGNGRSKRYALNDSGRERLAKLQPHSKLGGMATVPEFPPETVKYQQAYLLMQLFMAKDQQLKNSDANGKLSRSVRGNLELTPPVASEADSKLILGVHDAAHLLGRGDLLWKRGGGLLRLQSPFVGRKGLEEILRLV